MPARERRAGRKFRGENRHARQGQYADRRRGAGRSADRQRHTSRVLRPGRELSRGPGRFPRPRHRGDGLPARGRGRLHGRSGRQGDRPARHLLRHARAGLDQCGARHPHRAPGFDPDDHVRRPGGARHEGTRRLPGARLRRRLRRHRQMGDRDRRSGPRAGDRLARLLHRDRGAARPGGDRAARGHADRADRGAECAGLRAGRDLAGRDRHDEIAEDAVGRRAPRAAARRQPLVGGRAPPSDAARCSMRCIPATRAISASDRIPS
jgi:hypothetical protein